MNSTDTASVLPEKAMVDAPRVSLGLPVYNGENFLSEAIESALGQDFTDFELVISDNGSTDRTQEICESFAARDSRIAYHRVEENRGAAWNFNRVFELSRGTYFKWVAHDDLIDPAFLRECVAVLDTQPDVVLSYPRARVIGQEGETLEDYDVKLNTDSEDLRVRFQDLLRGHRCFEVFGLIRRDQLARTPLIGSFSHSDGVLLARLGLMGRFHEVPEHLFFPRRHVDQSMNVYKIYEWPADYHQYTTWFDPNAPKYVFPQWRIFSEFWKAVGKSQLKFGDRWACRRTVLRWAFARRRALLKDLKAAVKQFFRSKKKQPAA